MAINWLYALKAIPWADVVQAAPAIVKSARKLFNAARSSEPPPVDTRETYAEDDASLHARLSRVEAALQNVDAEQNASAELIRSLAEQNARVVEAIEVLRARTRVLMVVTTTLAVAFVVLAVWVATR